jgi:hypothetical protein
MFDINLFKKKIKEWIKTHPQGTETDLLDYCEELIPASQFSAHQWIIDQTLSWYQNILQSRKQDEDALDEDFASPEGERH